MPNARRVLVALAAVLLTAVPAAAQLTPQTGSRVRVVAPLVTTSPLTGTVAAASADSLTLALADGQATLALDRRSLQSLEVSRGRPRLKWGVLGAVVGLVGGSLLGATVGGYEDDSGWGALIGLIGGGIVGTPVGAVGGALIAPERWERLPLPPRQP